MENRWLLCKTTAICNRPHAGECKCVAGHFARTYRLLGQVRCVGHIRYAKMQPWLKTKAKFFCEQGSFHPSVPLTPHPCIQSYIAGLTST